MTSWDVPPASSSFPFPFSFGDMSGHSTCSPLVDDRPQLLLVKSEGFVVVLGLCMDVFFRSEWHLDEWHPEYGRLLATFQVNIMLPLCAA